MSNISVKSKVINNIPRLQISIIKDSLIKNVIFNNQIKNKLGDIFLDDAKKEKSNLSFIHGIEIERKIIVNSIEYKNNLYKILEDSNNEKIDYEFFDNNNDILPLISKITKGQESLVLYNISYFSFPSNLINLSDIKKEENIIFSHYNKFKSNISPAKSNKIAKQLKNSENLQQIDGLFYKIYEKNITATSLLSLNKRLIKAAEFTSKIIYDKENLLYEIASNNNVNNYEFSLDKVKIFTIANKKVSIIKQNEFRKNTIEYSIINDKIYFNILTSKSYVYFTNNYNLLKISFDLSIYENNKIIKKKSDAFTIQNIW